MVETPGVFVSDAVVDENTRTIRVPVHRVESRNKSNKGELSMGIAAEFKEFAMKGNVVDLAVGVIIGGAFGKIVDSLVGDVVMPVEEPSAVSTTEAVIRVAEEELIRFRSIAPFDGVIIKKWMEVGQWVQKGAPIAELVSRGQIDAVVDVPERVVNSVYVGEPIELQVDALKLRAEGKVDAVIPEGSSTARTFPVKIRLDDQKGKLKAGMSVTAWLPTGDKQTVLTVPRDAVLTSAAGNVIWVVADGKALKIDVDVLFGNDDRYAIAPARRGGPPLNPGTQVVIEGAERIFFPGQAVVISK